MGCGWDFVYHFSSIGIFYIFFWSTSNSWIQNWFEIQNSKVCRKNVVSKRIRLGSFGSGVNARMDRVSSDWKIWYFFGYFAPLFKRLMATNGEQIRSKSDKNSLDWMQWGYYFKSEKFHENIINKNQMIL